MKAIKVAVFRATELLFDLNKDAGTKDHKRAGNF